MEGGGRLEGGKKDIHHFFFKDTASGTKTKGERGGGREREIEGKRQVYKTQM